MRRLRIAAIAVALTMASSAPANAWFIFQPIKHADMELRVLGGEVLQSIAEVYKRVSELERTGSDELLQEGVSFHDLGNDLQNVVRKLDAYAESIGDDGEASIDIGKLKNEHEDMYGKVEFVFSNQSYAYHLAARHGLTLTLPETEREVFAQASSVITILSDTIAMTTLRTPDGDVDEVKKFQELNETILVLIDVLSSHSILLSTTR